MPAPFPKTAMVLGAGHGTRMRPLTDDRPKALVSVCGKPLIDHQLDRLGAAGVKRAIVNVHHFADLLETHVLARTLPPAITISDERTLLLDTGGALVNAKEALGTAPFFVINCDALWADLAHEPLAALHQTFGTVDAPLAVLLLARKSQCIGLDTAGDFHLDEDGRLRRRKEDEEAPYYYAGTQIMHPDLLGGEDIRPFSANHLWDKALGMGRLFGLVMDGFWLHVGDPQARREAQSYLRREPPR